MFEPQPPPKIYKIKWLGVYLPPEQFIEYGLDLNIHVQKLDMTSLLIRLDYE